MGPGRAAGGRRPPRLADDRRRACSRRLDDLEAFAEQVARRRAAPTPSCSAWAARRWRPRSSASSFGDADGLLRLHVLDSTDAGAVRDVEARDRPRRRRCSSSPRSPAGRSRRSSLFQHFWERPAATARSSSRSPTPARRSRSSPTERGFRRVVPQRPRHRRALQRAVVLRARARGAHGRRRRGAARAARRSPRRRCRAYDTAQDNSGLWLGVRARRARAARPRQADVRRRRRRCASFGLWVEQLVAESTGKHGKGILPVADEPLGAPEAYGDDRVFVHLRDARAPDADDDGASRALADAGHPVLTLRARRARPTSGGSSSSPSSPPRSPAGCSGINPFDQPNVQEAKDNTKRGPRRRRRADDRRRPTTTRCARCSTAGPPAYVAIHGLRRAARGRSTRRSPSCAPRSATRTRATTTFGYGPRYLHSTGQLHKGGPPTGRFLQLVARGRAGRRDPGRGRSPSRRSSARRPTATCATLRAHGLPAERVTLAAATRGALRALTDRSRRACADADRLRRPRPMGGNMVAPHPARLRPRGRRLRPRRGGGREGRRSTARAAPSSLEDLVAEARARRGSCGSWSPPATPTQEHRRRARRAARARATRSSTAATRSGPTTGAAPRRCAKQGIALRRRRHERRRLGPGGRLLHDGRRARRRRSSASRRSSTCSPRRPTEEHGPRLGPHRARPAPGHYVKMVHNGIEYGMMQAYAEGFDLFDKSRVRPRQREDRPPVDAGLGRALVAVRAGRARVRAGGQRPRRASSALHRRLRRGPLDDRGRDRQGRPDAGHHRRRCTRASTSRGNGDFTGRRCSPRCARSSAATRRSEGRTDDGDAPRRPTEPSNPLAEGLERLPGPPDDARHLRRDRRPRAAQAAAGALQPRPRGRAARALQPRRRLAQRDDRRGVPRAGARGDPRVLAPRRPTRRCSTSCSSDVALRRRARSTTTTVYDAPRARRSTRSTRRPASR